MAFFRKAASSKNRPPTQQVVVAAEAPVRERPEFTVQGLWTDMLGRLGIRCLQILIVGLVAGFVIIGMLRLTMIVIPTLIALILSCALWPLVTKLRKHLSPMLSAWVVFLGSLLVLGGIGTGLVFSVMREWNTLVNQAAEGFNQLNDLVQRFIGDMPFTVDQGQIDEAVDTVTSFITSAQFGAGALNTITAAGSFVTGSILLMVILFFFLKDGDRIWAFFISWTPKHYRHKWITSGDRALHTFGGYIRGTAIIAAVDAIGVTATLLVLQVPLALPLGVVVFLGAFIPMVGATVAGILATLVGLVTSGPLVALVVLAAVIIVNQLEGNFLQPVVMAQALNLHALVILMALTAGTVLGGIVGAVLAVPLSAVAWGIIKVWTERENMDAVAAAKAQIKIEAEIRAEDKALEKLKKKEKVDEVKQDVDEMADEIIANSEEHSDKAQRPDTEQ